MKHRTLNRILDIILTCAMTMICCLPMAAFATQSEVRMEGHGAASAPVTSVSALTIGGVEAPKPGDILDDTATVTSVVEQDSDSHTVPEVSRPGSPSHPVTISDEGASWEIPVLWVDPSLQLTTQANGERPCLPVLAFFLPEGVAVQDVDDADGFTVTLADDLVELFGSQDIITIHDEATGITYILPASIRGFLAGADGTADADRQAGQDSAASPVHPTEIAVTGTTQAPSSPAAHTPSPAASDPKLSPLVDIYCSQTARDALGQDDLEYLVDLIVNRLHPQAVNLLLESFPAFRTAAESGGIGSEIGLYIYYGSGDRDGDPAHEEADGNALAYVMGRHLDTGGSVRFGYLLAVNVESCALCDDAGRLVLIRDGEAATTLENTIVHELFHAIMDDYNRTGMVGATSTANAITDPDNATPEQLDTYARVHYPSWFIEGTASAVENVYQYRRTLFNLLTQAVPDPDDPGKTLAAGSARAVLVNYLTATLAGEPVHFMLDAAGDEGSEVDTTARDYVSGYLAVLYLSELAARSSDDIGTAISVHDGTMSISSERIRRGLNSILERMHDGETLDEVICSISPVDGSGARLYADVDDFERKFVAGKRTVNGAITSYAGDTGTAGEGASLEFVAAFLTYMDDVSSTDGRMFDANGSILSDFDKDFSTPLDRTQTDSTDTLGFVESNTYVDSTVPDETALAGGGKSESSATEKDAPEATPAAAKTAAKAAAGASTAAAEAEGTPAVAEEAAGTPTVAEEKPGLETNCAH
ncbi:MAG: hypothetical protein Q4A93_03365 [Actinomycetota bacterium]|nr:hypothetical protein [Actinomycetota bacterium]